MSYDFYIAIDTGGEEEHCIEPFFSDELPALDGQGGGGMTAVVTATGYSRCGNYTTNVSPMWAKCLTAVMDEAVEWRAWAGADAKAFNATGRTCSYRQGDGTWVRDAPMPVDEDRLCLRDLQGRSAAELAPLLGAAVEWGVEHLDELREMNPENGWGDAEGAVTYLWDIQRMCERHPKGRLRISS